jgi:ABC-type transport system involved in multi-copper enzyme maturation permease subunit
MNGQMIAAEVLKLVRRRGQIIWALILTVGAVVVMYGITWGYHLSNATKYAPAGGSHNLESAMWVIATVGGIASVLIGTTAGVGDQSAGVFRELVVTGRSRIALFAARIPGAWIVLLPMVLLAFAVAVACTFALAGGQPTPSPGQIGKDAVWLIAVATVQLLVALGFSAVVGSRATAVGVLLGWELALSPLLLSIDQLGVIRQLVPRAAELRLEPFSAEPLGFAMTAGAAVAVLLTWTVVPLAAAARRTVRLEA